MDDRDNEKSEFNDAVEHLRAIRMNFNLCHDCRLKNDLYFWSRALNNIYNELSTYLRKRKIVNSINELDSYKKELQSIFNSISHIVDKQNRKGTQQSDVNLYWRMNDFELVMRKVYDETGLQNRMAEDAYKALR